MSIASKNLYELLGNDPELDPDRPPSPPVQPVDKPATRHGKRNATEAPEKQAPTGPRANKGGVITGNEAAFKDRTGGSINNRARPIDDGLRHDRHSGRLDGGGRFPEGSRGGRGGRGRGGRAAAPYDRHSRTNVADSGKQVSQGWGGVEGEKELADEQAGEAIAKEEEKEGFDTAPGEPVSADGAHPGDGQPAAEPEPEDNSKSYTEYLAELAAKKLQLGGTPEARKPNEGSNGDKKWANAKPLTRQEEEEAYIAGSNAKAKREKQRKEKNLIDIDQQWVEAPRDSGRGGRGGRGRGGEFRGRARGEGFRGRGGRGAPRGGAAPGSSVNLKDESAFPSLGKA